MEPDVGHLHSGYDRLRRVGTFVHAQPSISSLPVTVARSRSSCHDAAAARCSHEAGSGSLLKHALGSGGLNVGQVPVTHPGRAATVVLMLFMPIIIAFITASTTKSLNLTPDESNLMRGHQVPHARTQGLPASVRGLWRYW